MTDLSKLPTCYFKSQRLYAFKGAASGFVCDCHPVVPGLNPKHIINAFSTYT